MTKQNYKEEALARDDEPWLPTEDAFLIGNFPKLSVQEIASKLRLRSFYSVQSRKNLFKSFYDEARFTPQLRDLTPLVRSMIGGMRESGYTIEDIAKALKLKDATVYAVIAEPMMKKL